MKADAGRAVPAGATLGASVPRTRSVLTSLHPWCVAIPPDMTRQRCVPMSTQILRTVCQVPTCFGSRAARPPISCAGGGTAYLMGRTRILRVAGRIGAVAFSCGFPILVRLPQSEV